MEHATTTIKKSKKPPHNSKNMQSLTKECLLPMFPDVRLPKLVKLGIPGTVFVNKNRANDMRLNGAVDVINAIDTRFHSPYRAGA
jgi:hypothetical protein